MRDALSKNKTYFERIDALASGREGPLKHAVEKVICAMTIKKGEAF